MSKPNMNGKHTGPGYKAKLKLYRKQSLAINDEYKWMNRN